MTEVLKLKTALKLDDLMLEATNSVITSLPKSSIYRGRCTLEVYVNGSLLCVFTPSGFQRGLKMSFATDASPGEMFLLGAALSKSGFEFILGKPLSPWKEAEFDRRDRGTKHVVDKHRKVYGEDPSFAEIINLFGKRK